MSKRTVKIEFIPITQIVGPRYNPEGEYWKVVVLLRNGRSLFADAYEQMDESTRKKLLANLKAISCVDRVRNQKIARSWRHGDGVWEVKALAWHCMFFYVVTEANLIIVTAVHKGAGKLAQDRAFEAAHALQHEALENIRERGRT